MKEKNEETWKNPLMQKNNFPEKLYKDAKAFLQSSL